MTFLDKAVTGLVLAILFAWLAFLFCIIPGAFRDENDDINGGGDK